MANAEILKGKKLLIVDDEPDILESLKELLDMCDVDSASDYDGASRLLEEKQYDLAILDIMGVRGYDLLDLANEKGIPAIMLTAHALSPQDLAKSVKEGARAYLPKDKIAEIDTFLADVFQEAGDKERGKLGRWFKRLETYYANKFGPDWLERFKGSWE